MTELRKFVVPLNEGLTIEFFEYDTFLFDKMINAKEFFIWLARPEPQKLLGKKFKELKGAEDQKQENRLTNSAISANNRRQESGCLETSVALPKVSLNISNCLKRAEQLKVHSSLLREMDPWSEPAPVLGKRDAALQADPPKKAWQPTTANLLALGYILESAIAEFYRRTLLIKNPTTYERNLRKRHEKLEYEIDLRVRTAERLNSPISTAKSATICVEIKTCSSWIFDSAEISHGLSKDPKVAKDAKKQRMMQRLREKGVLDASDRLLPSHSYVFQALFYCAKQPAGSRGGELVFLGPEGILVVPFVAHDESCEWVKRTLSKVQTSLKNAGITLIQDIHDAQADFSKSSLRFEAIRQIYQEYLSQRS